MNVVRNPEQADVDGPIHIPVDELRCSLVLDKDSKSPDIPARRASGQPLCLPLGFHLGRKPMPRLSLEKKTEGACGDLSDNDAAHPSWRGLDGDMLATMSAPEYGKVLCAAAHEFTADEKEAAVMAVQPDLVGMYKSVLAFVRKADA